MGHHSQIDWYREGVWFQDSWFTGDSTDGQYEVSFESRRAVALTRGAARLASAVRRAWLARLH
jgi:hypothetical protein